MDEKAFNLLSKEAIKHVEEYMLSKSEGLDKYQTLGLYEAVMEDLNQMYNTIDEPTDYSEDPPNPEEWTYYATNED